MWWAANEHVSPASGPTRCQASSWATYCGVRLHQLTTGGKILEVTAEIDKKGEQTDQAGEKTKVYGFEPANCRGDDNVA